MLEPGSSDLLRAVPCLAFEAGVRVGLRCPFSCVRPEPCRNVTGELCFPRAPAALGHAATLAVVSWLPPAQPQAAVTVPLAPFQSLSEPYVEYLTPFHGASLMMPLSRCLC